MINFNKKIELFKQKISEIFPDKYPLVLDAINNPPLRSFRIVKVEKTKQIIDSLSAEGIVCAAIALIENAFCVIQDSSLGGITNSDVFKNKDIYIQELSSMLPVVVLDPQIGEKILDLCASPGSKTTYISNLTQNQANIIAVEKNSSRFFKLKRNIDDFNSLAELIKIDGNLLHKVRPDLITSFDKVLVDVPCSNEGSIVLNLPSTIKYWNMSESRKISKLQRGLLNSGFKFLKKGGTLIYSTCTFSVEENEEVVDWFLKKNSDGKLLEIRLELDCMLNGYTSFKNKVFSSNLSKTRRVLPNKMFTGFFLAKITKV